MKAQFQPFPVLLTKRLQLRQMQDRDSPELFEQRTMPEMLTYTEIKPPENEEEVVRFIQKINDSISQNASIYWALSLQNQAKLMGTICLWNLSPETNSAEIGFSLHPEFQKQGFMQEALKAVLAFGFGKMELDTIMAYSQPENIPSLKLLQNHGFEFKEKVDKYNVYSNNNFSAAL